MPAQIVENVVEKGKEKQEKNLDYCVHERETARE
jgi:hypothetical protein